MDSQQGKSRRSVATVMKINPQNLEANDIADINIFKKYQFLMTIVACCFQLMWAWATVFGALYSIQAHVCTLTNLHGMISLLTVIYFKGSVSKQEGIVLILLTIGILSIMFDPFSKRVIPRKGFSMKNADIIMLLSSFPAALFFTMNKVLMENRLLSYLIVSNSIAGMLYCLAAIYIEDATVDMNPITGLFGWLNYDHLFINIAVYGGLNTFLGNVGYLLSMHFFSPIVVMNALLIEPFFAQSIGYLVGLDEFPSIYTIGGVCCVTGALYIYNRQN